MQRLLVGLSLMLLSQPASAQRTIPTANLATVSARGAAIYAYDQAAWHTSDTMVAKHLPEAVMRAIRGWVVEPRGDVLTVTYFGRDGDKPYAIYIADFRDGAVSNERVPEAGSAERTLTPLGLRLAAARVTATDAAASLPRCNDRRYNSVVLPPEPDGTIPVYLLTPQVENDQYPMGGHHEIDIAADGNVAGKRDFTKSCLIIGGPATKPGEKPVALYITHLLDPHPTEIHVFTSLSAHYPVFVGTSDKDIWSVEGARISKIDPKKLRGAPQP
jgi:hypothetical protein